MSDFKVGDRVRRTGVTRDEAVNGQEYVVRGTHAVCDEVYLEGLSLSYSAGYFELIPPVEPTDKELADEYRALRAKAKTLSTELRKRGFTPQTRMTIYDSWLNLAPHSQAEFRFIKIVTTNTEV